MAKVTIILRDQPDGVSAEFVFDPPLKGGVLETQAQVNGANIYKLLSEDSEEVDGREMN